MRPETTITVPEGVPTALYEPTTLGPVVDPSRPRISVLSTEVVLNAGQLRPNRLMPWQAGYEGPERLLEYSEGLREPGGLGPQMVPTVGGSQSSAITPLPGGEVEFTQVIRTRYVPVGRLGPCPTCGLVRLSTPPRPTRAASPERKGPTTPPGPTTP